MSPFHVKCIVVQINIMKEIPGGKMICSCRLSSVFSPLKAYLNGTVPPLAATLKWLQVPAFAFLAYNIWILLVVY